MPLCHPCRDENGKACIIHRPTVSTALDSWNNPACIATCSLTDHGAMPEAINGVAFTNIKTTLTIDQWLRNSSDWHVREPDPPESNTLTLCSGCIVIEPDKRLWIVHPSNQFHGVEATFPKGQFEKSDVSLIANAVRETFEESGLFVEPVEFLCDVVRTSTVTRYYVARRIAGSPAMAQWESQAVSLVPVSKLTQLLNRPNDHKVLPDLFAWISHHPDFFSSQNV